MKKEFRVLWYLQETLTKIYIERENVCVYPLAFKTRHKVCGEEQQHSQKKT